MIAWAELWQDWRVSVAMCALSWGVWAFLGKVAAGRLGWPTTLVISYLAGLALLPVIALKGARWPGLVPSLWAVGYGLCGAVGSAFFLRALTNGPASAVAPLAEAYLIVTVLLAVLVLGEELDARRIAGLVCMLAGVVLLSGR